MGAPLLLAALVWFAALAKAAHDYWACVVVFTLLSLMAGFLLIRRARSAQSLQFPMLLPWLATVTAVWLSSLHSWDITSSLWDAWGWTFTGIFFYLVVNLIETDAQERLFLRVAGSVVVPITLFAVYQQATGSPQGYAVLAIGPIALRYGHWEIHSTLINAVVFAGFLSAWALYWWTEQAGRWVWIPRFAVFLGLLLSRSWFVWIALTGGWAFRHMFTLTPSRRKRFAVGAAGMLLIGTLTVTAWKSCAVQQPDANAGSYRVTGRMAYWRSAMHMFKDHPWTGIGWSGFNAAYGFYKPGEGEGSRFAHSFPLQIAAETGLFGIAAFALWLASFFRYRPWRLRPLPSAAVIVLLGMSLITIVMNYLLMLMMLAVWMALALRGTPQPVPRKTLTVHWAWVGVAVLFTCSSYWVRLFQAERLYAAGYIAQARALNPSIGVIKHAEGATPGPS